MTYNTIVKLAEQSYINEILDQKTVEALVSRFSRKELKQYINTLNKLEKAKTVIVTLPIKEEKIYEKAIQGLFQNKKIVYNRDQSLIGGIRIQNNDSIYELSIKNLLTSLYTYITL